jgi:hypothetical protein
MYTSNGVWILTNQIDSSSNMSLKGQVTKWRRGYFDSVWFRYLRPMQYLSIEHLYIQIIQGNEQ